MKNEGVKKMNIKVSNLDDEMRKYDISANVWVNEEGNIENIEDGAVIKDDLTVATFARYANNSHKTYIGLNADEELEVAIAIKDFVEGVHTLATGINL